MQHVLFPFLLLFVQVGAEINLTQNSPYSIFEGALFRFEARPAAEEISGVLRNASRPDADPADLYWAAQMRAEGWTSDEVPIADYLMQAVKKEYPPAMASYGIFQVLGKFGIEQDVEKGLLLLESAYGLNDPSAAYQLGMLYFGAGSPIPPDLDRARDYFNVAIQRGVYSAHWRLAQIAQQRQDDSDLLIHTKAGAKLGDPVLITQMVEWHKGQTSLHNPEEAVRWMKIGALRRIPAMQRFYAVGLDEEYGDLKKNPSLSASLLEQAVHSGDQEARVLIAVGKIFGRYGQPVNSEEGVRALIELVNNQIPSAQYELGLLYYDGGVVLQDQQKGMKLLEEAALRGYEPAVDKIKQLQRN